MKRSQKAGIIGAGSLLLFTGALPAAALPVVPPIVNGPDAAFAPAVPFKYAVMDSVYGNVDSKTSLAVPTDTKVSKDEAIALARKIVQIPDDYAVDNVSFQSVSGALPSMNGPSWQINFSKKVEDRFYGSIYVGIQADTGKLLQFGRYTNNPGERPSYPPKTDLKAGKSIAEDFIRELYPEQFKQTRYNTLNEANFKTPLNGDVRYGYRFDRTVNGVPYPANGFNVDVDGNGQVVSFNSNWNDQVKFEEAGKIISKEEAIGIWKKESLLAATYFKPYERNRKDVPFDIAYQFVPAQVEAATGKLWPAGASFNKDLTPLTQAPLGEAPKPSGALTKDQAIQAVADKFTLPKNAKLEDVSYNEYTDQAVKEPEGIWNIRWTLSEEESTDGKKKLLPYPNYVYAAVNAQTGDIRSYYVNNYMYPTAAADGEEWKVSFEDAKSKAVDFVKKIAPHLTHQLVPEYTDPGKLPEEIRSKQPTYSFAFKRVVDGVTAGYESVNIAIDRKTGDITSFNSSLTNQTYSAPKPKLLEPEQALKLWESQYDLELQYVGQWSNGYPYPYGLPMEKYNVMVAAGEIPPGTNPGDITNKLVYVPVPKYQNVTYNIYLDAVTGEWKNSNNGLKAVFGKIEAEDAIGHWAGRELQLMAEYNALDVKDGKVNPDQIATRGEMVKMLLIAMNGGYFPMSYDSKRAASFADVKSDNPYFAYVENAVDRNLIDKAPDGTFNPDAPMTREDLAELIVRALGYNSLAKVPDLFRLNVDDASAITKQGHVALVLGLGIMTAPDGSFIPKEEVTRAQAAVAFYRYLEKRGTLQDQLYKY